jgi:hypothetical protein
LAGLAALVALAGCGAGGDGGAVTDSTPQSQASAPAPRADGARAPRAGKRPPFETVAPSRCPAGLPRCRTTEGRIVYVERVDPDGDGDAHFVVVDSQGITLPGLTAIDVRRGLRPHPLPNPGDLVSAAGPLETGSYGESEIHALELHVAGR